MFADNFYVILFIYSLTNKVYFIIHPCHNIIDHLLMVYWLWYMVCICLNTTLAYLWIENENLVSVHRIQNSKGHYSLASEWIRAC